MAHLLAPSAHIDSLDLLRVGALPDAMDNWPKEGLKVLVDIVVDLS